MNGDMQINPEQAEGAGASPDLRGASLSGAAGRSNAAEPDGPSLEAWVRRREALEALFGAEDLGALDRRRQAVDLSQAQAVYVSYENPWARCDHGSELAGLLADAVGRLGIKTHRLSFLHRNLDGAPAAIYAHWTTM